MTPVRIHRKRAKGWRMPPNCVYVGRGSVWGNPFRIGEHWRHGVRPDIIEGIALHDRADRAAYEAIAEATGRAA